MTQNFFSSIFKKKAASGRTCRHAYKTLRNSDIFRCKNCGQIAVSLRSLTNEERLGLMIALDTERNTCSDQNKKNKLSEMYKNLEKSNLVFSSDDFPLLCQNAMFILNTSQNMIKKHGPNLPPENLAKFTHFAKLLTSANQKFEELKGQLIREHGDSLFEDLLGSP